MAVEAPGADYCYETLHLGYILTAPHPYPSCDEAFWILFCFCSASADTAVTPAVRGGQMLFCMFVFTYYSNMPRIVTKEEVTCGCLLLKRES